MINLIIFIYKNLDIFLYVFCEFIKFQFGLISFNLMLKNICNAIGKRNIFYLKMFQWGIQENYKLNKELIEYFNTFSNNVPYDNEELEYANFIINKANQYAQSNGNILILDDDKLEPINSGTVALVFKGKYNDKDVAIKILRKNIKSKIKEGINDIIEFLNLIILLASFFYINIEINMKDILKNNEELLISQCDFTNEIENLELFNKNMEKHEDIIIPIVYKEFLNASNDLIIMEFLKGRIMSNCEKNELSLYYPLIIKFIFESIFIHRNIHADLHVGNILILDEGKIGIIDFGLVNHNSKIFTNNLFNFIINLSNNNKKLLVKYLVNLLLDKKENLNKENINQLNELIINKVKIQQDLTFSLDEIIELISNLKYLKNYKIDPLICKNILGVLSSLASIEKFGDKKPIGVIFNECLEKYEL